MSSTRSRASSVSSSMSSTSASSTPPKSSTSKVVSKVDKGTKRPAATSGEGSKTNAGSKRPSTRRRVYSFRIFIYRILKTKSDNKTLGISSAAMAILNSFVVDMIERIGEQASQLAFYEGKKTVTESDIISAIKLTIPYDHELTPQLVSAAAKAARSLRGK